MERIGRGWREEAEEGMVKGGVGAMGRGCEKKGEEG